MKILSVQHIRAINLILLGAYLFVLVFNSGITNTLILSPSCPAKSIEKTIFNDFQPHYTLPYSKISFSQKLSLKVLPSAKVIFERNNEDFLLLNLKNYLQFSSFKSACVFLKVIRI